MFTVAGGIYQNTVYGMAAKLPFKYTGAVVLGSVSSCRKGNLIAFRLIFFLFSPIHSLEYQRNFHSRHQRHLNRIGSECPYLGHLLFHRRALYSLGLLRLFLRLASQCTNCLASRLALACS